MLLGALLVTVAVRVGKLGLAVALLAALAPMPARANHSNSHVEHTFTASVPCAAACPHVLTSEEAACAPQPATVDGSWAEIQVRSLGGIQEFDLYPFVDYDLFVCRVTPSESGSYLVGASTTGPGDPGCDDPTPGRFPAGCPEFLVTAVPAGELLRFRVFNFSDFAPAPGRVRGAERV